MKAARRSYGGEDLGPLGIPETIFIFVLALLIFGPKKLPELGRTIGKAMTEFRRASSELKATFDREMNAIEREADLKSVTQDVSPSETYNYDSYYDSGAYGYDSYESTAQTSTESASATQGADTKADETKADASTAVANAESGTACVPEGTENPDKGIQPIKS